MKKFTTLFPVKGQGETEQTRDGSNNSCGWCCLYSLLTKKREIALFFLSFRFSFLFISAIQSTTLRSSVIMVCMSSSSLNSSTTPSIRYFEAASAIQHIQEYNNGTEAPRYVI